MAQQLSSAEDDLAGNDVKASNEEDALLETLQASREDQNIYEEKVIREATHQLAPRLTGVGFPSLQSLIHSNGNVTRPSTDLPHLHSVLGKTRRAQRNEDDQPQSNADLLLLKEQILLEYMNTIVQVPAEDLPIRKNEEQWLMKRQSKQRAQSQLTRQNNQKTTFGASVRSTPSSSSMAGRRSLQRVPLNRQTMQGKNKFPLPSPHNEGEQARDFDGDEPDDDEPQQTREELRKLRKQRLELREARRKARQQLSDDEDDVEFSEEPVKKAAAIAADDDGEDTHVTAADDSAMDKEGTLKADEKNEKAKSELICPLCSMQIEYLNENEKDSALAVHMESCQQPEGRTRRSRRILKNKLANQTAGETCNETNVTIRLSTIQSSKKRKRKHSQPCKATSKQSIQRNPLDDIDELDYEDRVDDWISNGISKMRHMSELDDINDDSGAQDYGNGLVVPAWINDRLFGYQRDGLSVMWEWHKQQAGGILGDEMGLGKTVSVSAFLGSLTSCRRLRSCLIIVPATMMNHWLTELATWAPGLRRILIHNSAETDQGPRVLTPKLLNSLDKWLRKCRSNRVNECIDEEDRKELPPHSFCGTGYVIITTYENVRRNSSVYVGHNFSYVVLDEAQKIRNPDADITLACKRFRSPHRIAMSGTPIMNDLKELWSIVDFCFPGRLGTLPAFEQEFADPIRKGGYSNASPMQAQLAYRCALVLRDLIEPHLLRRLKKDVKEVSRMPTKTEHVLFCRLSARQRTLYESFLQSGVIAKVMRGSTNLLGAITMLRKICNHPDLICDPNEKSLERFVKNGFENTVTELSDDENDEDGDILEEETLVERSGKLEVLSKILPLWKKQGHRVLIFCQWRKMLNIIQQFMIMQGWKFGRLDGNTNVAARQRLVDAFNSDESYFAMLCTTRTGGVGLNLTGASRVCLYSPDWNPQIDAQARERAWRFGQKKEVTVYRLITAGTVEEKIYQRQIFKTALSNRVLQDPRQRRLFSQRDLRDLFTLRDDSGSISSGGHGVTETGEKTRGAGVMDTDKGEQDETNLKDVMRSKGLAGIFDHNIIENSSSKKGTTAREMEEEAKRVALEAAKALRESVPSSCRYAPVGEVGENYQSQRFGVSAGSLFQSSGTHADASSKGLLASLKQRSESVKISGATVEPVQNLGEYTQLLSRIREYVKKRKPSTDAILKDFSDISSDDIAIFRRLLKSVAMLKNGRWISIE